MCAMLFRKSIPMRLPTRSRALRDSLPGAAEKHRRRNLRLVQRAARDGLDRGVARLELRERGDRNSRELHFAGEQSGNGQRPVPHDDYLGIDPLLLEEPAVLRVHDLPRCVDGDDRDLDLL